MLSVTRKISPALSLILFSCLWLAGCLSWTTENGDSSQTRHCIGYTRISLPRTIAPGGQTFEVKEIENWGISGGPNGLALGYSAHKQVKLPPDNAFYIQVATQEQFDRLYEFITRQKEANLWVIKSVSD
ncbi:MAG: hypothetical protein HUN04_11880 [Desulfobacter sp.]|nr:MAG: hypothetical protein HUN04_11880 [Desulfobacter sp.]